MNPRTKRALGVAPLLSLVLALSLFAWPRAALAGGVTATFSKSSQWDSGFVGAYTITNSGPATIAGWRLEFDLPSDASVTGSWNGRLTRSANHYTVLNDTWNGSLGAGSSATFGFQVATTAPSVVPGNCLLNGAPCSGGGGGPTTTTAPATTTTTRPPATTTTTTAPATTTTTTVPGGGGGGGTGTTPVFAPYADVTLWPPVDLSATATASGVKQYTLAFIVDGSTSCQASWGGVVPLADSPMGSQIAQLRAKGGDVIVSFGGASGQELAQTCTSLDALVNQYQAVIDRYNLTRIDFDVEGAAAAQPASIARRSQAIATLQARAAAAGKRLEVSLTLPVLPSGLTADGVNVVRSARDAGAVVSVVNIMAMDYGDWAAPGPAGKMGKYAIDAATSLRAQLQNLYPAKTDAQLWRMVGITPMIGQNDVQSEVFTTADAQQVVTFANQRRIGRLSMWSVARDKQCSGGVTPWADPTCSGILQQQWDFSKVFRSFVG